MLTIGNQSESDADAPEGVSAFLALGGNLGDREAVFRDALRRYLHFMKPRLSGVSRGLPRFIMPWCAADGAGRRRLC